MVEIEQIVIQLVEWWQLSLRRDVAAYAHSCQAKYKMSPKGPIYNKNDDENPKIPKRNPRI